jgi:uncharacterized protein YndB with AHSA1/START domain
MSRIIRCEVRTPAPADQVWQAWADPARIRQWFTDTAEGNVVPGGVYTWGWTKFGAFAFPYQVQEAVPGEKLTLGGAPPGGPPFLLEITIARSGGDTVVRLVNSGFREDAAWEDEYQGIVSGWQMSLHLLKLYVENYFGQPRTQFLARRTAAFDFSAVSPLQRTEHGLEQWLTRSGQPGEPLTLRDGTTVSGRVLTATNTETLLEWREIGGALALKAFQQGDRRELALHGVSWRLPQEQMDRWEPEMSAALARLAAALEGGHKS